MLPEVPPAAHVDTPLTFARGCAAAEKKEETPETSSPYEEGEELKPEPFTDDVR